MLLKYNILIVVLLQIILEFTPSSSSSSSSASFAVLDSSCENDEECRLRSGVNPEGMWCSKDRRCACSEGYIKSGWNNKCLPIRNQTYEKCEEDGQCLVKVGSREVLTHCANNRCLCWPSPSECFLVAGRVGDLCRHDLECQAKLGENSACTETKRKNWRSSGVCTCTNGTTPIDNFSKCGSGPVLIGSPCGSQSSCVGAPTSECTISGSCACTKGHVPTKYLDECLPIVDTLGGACTESHQCQAGAPGLLSECREMSSGGGGMVNKACHCKNDSVNEPGSHKCLKIPTDFRHSRDPYCTTHVECVAAFGSSVCVEGHCVCVSGTEYSGERGQCWVSEWKQEAANPPAALPKAKSASSAQGQGQPGQYPVPSSSLVKVYPRIG